MSQRRFTFGQASDKGPREYNEDAALSLVLSGAVSSDGEDIGLFIVVDGAGANGAGKIIARLTLQTIAKVVIEQLGTLPANVDPEPSTFSAILSSAFQKANEAVMAINTREWGGMATATAVLIVQQQIYIANVGDVKGYIVSKAGIEPITISHDFVSELVRRGITSYRKEHKVYRAFGFEETPEVDITVRELKQDDSIVICCDGIWECIPDDQIQKITSDYPDPQEACEQLIAATNANEPYDNMTAIVVKMSE